MKKCLHCALNSVTVCNMLTKTNIKRVLIGGIMSDVVRINGESAGMLNKLADEMDRSKTWVASRAIKLFAESLKTPTSNASVPVAISGAADMVPVDSFGALYRQRLVPLGFADLRADVIDRMFGREIAAASRSIGGLGGLGLFFAAVERSDYLCGRTAARRTAASLEWMLKPDNLKKIISGGYETAENGGNTDDEALGLLERELSENPELWSSG